MVKISINLLPPEILEQQFKKAKFYKIQTAGIVIVLLLVFLSSLTVALGILQNRNISMASAQVTQAEQKAANLKNTQATLLLLDDRLKAINAYWGVSSKQSSIYKLITKLMPSSIAVTAISIDRNSAAVFPIVAPDSISLEDFIIQLTSKEENEGKISQVVVDNLNRGRDGFYRVSLTVKPK